MYGNLVVTLFRDTSNCWTHYNQNYVCLIIIVGMVKAPTSETSEFTMSSKDFPALPGTQPLSVTTTSSTTTDPNQQTSITTSGATTNSLDQNGIQSSSDHLSDQRLNNLNSQTDNNSQENGDSGIKKGVQTSPDGLYYIFILLIDCLICNIHMLCRESD